MLKEPITCYNCVYHKNRWGNACCAVKDTVFLGVTDANDCDNYKEA